MHQENRLAELDQGQQSVRKLGESPPGGGRHLHPRRATAASAHNNAEEHAVIGPCGGRGSDQAKSHLQRPSVCAYVVKRVVWREILDQTRRSLEMLGEFRGRGSLRNTTRVFYRGGKGRPPCDARPSARQRTKSSLEGRRLAAGLSLRRPAQESLRCLTFGLLCPEAPFVWRMKCFRWFSVLWTRICLLDDKVSLRGSKPAF